MSFSEEWENCYVNNSQISLWPWTDLVSMVHRHCSNLILNKDGKVLELGCGAGANIPFFLANGFDYHAIEGSSTIVKTLKKRFPQISRNIEVADFVAPNSMTSMKNFDLIVDRAAITHNDSISIQTTIDSVFDSLKQGGLFIGSDWFSVEHDDMQLGITMGDPFTKTNFEEGQFKGIGKVHFSNEIFFKNIFSKFKILLLEEKIVTRVLPKKHKFASWNIVAMKQ